MRRLAALVVTVLALLPLAAFGGEPAPVDDRPASVLLTFTVTDRGAARDAATRVVHLRGLDGRRTRLQTGWRLPIPTTTVNATTAGQPPVTAFQYQDVGMTVAVECRIVGENALQLEGQLEISAEGAGPRPGIASGPPTLSTLSHRFDVALEAGTETVLAQVPGPDGGEMTLSVRASIAR